MFERAPGDPAWRHNENSIMAGRPSRELVLRTAAAIGNYDYMMDWIFQQDGTIRVRVGATGIVEVKGSKDVVAPEETMTDGKPTPQQGTLVAPNTVAVYHDHYLCFRLDLDVDGQNNSFMVDRLVPRKIQARTRTSIWGVESTLAKSESDGHPGHRPAQAGHVALYQQLPNAALWVIPRAMRSCPRQQRLIFYPPMTRL